MQMALTVWEGHISPLFDVTRMLMIVHVEDGRVVDQRYEPLDCESALLRAARLNTLGIDVLICGGITHFYAGAIEAHGIRIIPFSAGVAEEVLKAYLKGKIDRTKYRMPGCEMLKTTPGIYGKALTKKEANRMKIAITASGTTLEENVEPRFGRCPYFIFVNPETMEFESLTNPNIALGGGAGPQSAQLMAEHGVSVVLTGNCGPNAFQTFGAAGIQVIMGVGGRVRDAVEQFKAGQLRQSGAPTVQSHYGMGGGMGMGGGRGMSGSREMGRGMGGGGGYRRNAMVGAGVSASDDAASDVSSDRQEIARLKQTVQSLRRQLEAIENKIGTNGEAKK